MKSFVAPLLAACLVLTACGSTAETVESDAAQADADVAATTVAETTTTSVAPESDEESKVADDAMEDADSADDSEPQVVGSINDIPEVCRELMADFLREIEPVVSDVDWEKATMADFEAVSLEFEPIADEFEAANEAEEQCDDIELEDDENFALLIDFAEDEAPGAVGFLTFLNTLLAGFTDAMDAGAEGGAVGSCEDAIAFVQGLADEYDSMTAVPIDQLAQMADVGTAMISCSPEQLEFFDSPAIADFLSGS